MTNPDGPLIPRLRYDHLLSVNQEQSSPPPVSSTAEIQPLHRRQQPEPIGVEIPISQSQGPEQHQFVKSIGDLAALSAAIDAFKRQYDDLQRHIEFIENSIHSRLCNADFGSEIGASSSVLPPQLDAAANEPPQVSTATVPESSEKPEEQRLCELMCSKGLRKYILNNLANAAKLMKEIPPALKLAKDPSKLVFECIGRFYLQGRKAFSKDSPMIPARKASLLVMECFLLMADCDDTKLVVESSTKAEAEKAAVAWRKRLMSEGGLAKAEPMDARGLLLLIACFGVPSNFRNMNLLELVRQSNAFEISGALRRSSFLVPMIPGIIDASIKRGMHVDAVELVYTFGLVDKFSPPSILISFLRMNKEAFENAKRKAHSPIALKKANESQLSVLVSVIRCLETHDLDSGKVLAGWRIKDQMIELERNIFELNKEIEEKERSIRILEESIHAERLYNQEMKRQRISSLERTLPTTSYSSIYHDQIFPNHGDDISTLMSNYLGSPSSFPHRSRANLVGHGLGRGVSFEAYKSNLPSVRSRQFSPIHGETLVRQYSPIGPQSHSGQQNSSLRRF